MKKFSVLFSAFICLLLFSGTAALADEGAKSGGMVTVESAEVMPTIRAAAQTSAEIADQGTDGNISWRIEYDDQFGGWTMYFSGSGPMQDYTYGCGDPPWERSKSSFYLVKRVVFESGITYIGESTLHFTEASSRLALEKIVIADTVTGIGRAAFANLQQLREVEIPSSVKTIGEAAFGWCPKLEKVTLHEGLEVIGADAFSGCNYLQSISIPSTVRTVGEKAFYDCPIRRVAVPAGVVSIGANAFGYGSGSTGPAKVFNFTIQGTAGSQAEIYARSNGFLFTTSSADVPAPSVSAANVSLNTVKISWSSVSGASKYELLYKGGSASSWTPLADVTGTSYTWKSAETGTSYSFRVRAADAAGTPVSRYADSASLTTLYPALKPKVRQVGANVEISWERQTAVDRFRVFYRISSGSWKKISDVEASSYIWGGADGGAKYFFMVRRIKSDGTYLTAADSTGVPFTVSYSCKAPKISRVENVNGGVKITWKKVAGAAQYRVFYRSGSGGWKRLKDTKSVSYTWKKAKSGTKYSFTVRCISVAGKNTSSYDKTGKSIRCLSMPALSSAKKSGSGIKVKWKKTKGATGYLVYRRTSKSGWKKIAKTKSLSYTDKKAKKGTKYRYTVRAYYGSVKSSYNTKGLSAKR